MKKVINLLLIALLAFTLCFAFTACDEKENETQTVTKTKMTLELTDVEDDDALITEQIEIGGVKYDNYYTITGYSFSNEDAAIVTRALNDKYHYTDYYTGEKYDGYEADKARYEQMSNLTLPVKVVLGATKTLDEIELNAEQISAANGVIDLSAGAEETKEVYVCAVSANALSGHTEIVNLVVPDTYKYIGEGAFSGCSAIEEIKLPFVGAKADALNGAKTFGYIFGTTAYTGGASVTQNYNASGTATYYVPEKLATVTVTETLPKYAFYNVTSIKEINYTLNAAGEVPAYAFYGCAGLKSIDLTGVTVIGEGAFSGCASLNAVTLPATLTSIEASAFSGCTNLCYTSGKLAIAQNVTFIGENAFSGCTSIKELEVTGPAAKVEIKAGAFASCTSLEKATLTNAKLSVGVFSKWSSKLTAALTGCECAAEGLNVRAAFVGGFEEGDPALSTSSQKANLALTIN